MPLTTKRCYVFDIDGTVADCSHRLHYIKGCKGKPDWDAFFIGCVDDRPIEHVIGLVALLDNGETDVVFVSGRSDQVRDQTVDWLTLHVPSFCTGLRMEHLYMRTAGDHRPDYEVKEELLQVMILDGWEPIMAFDDRQQVVDMWRRNGIPCAQVAEGNF